MKHFLLSLFTTFLCFANALAYSNDDFVWDFEWLEDNNTIEIVVGEGYQLHYSCSSNYDKVFSAEMASNWVHYDFKGGQHVVDPPTGYSISETGIITGLIPGNYAMKFTGLIQPKAGADKWLYINVVAERREKESNNTLDTANDIYTKIRFGLSNLSDVDYFRFKHNLSFGDHVTFKVHYEGYNDSPFGYKWATFMGDKEMCGGGSLIQQDQECNALVANGEYVYFEVYYNPSYSQYFTYGEEFVVQVYVNGEPVTNETVNVSNISISPSSISLKQGESYSLSASVSPSNATDKSVSWSSSNTSVATVNSNGKVTAVGLGTATITATANDGSGVKGTCSVTVEATPVTQITLSQTTASLKVGETITLTATVSPSNATDKSVSWSSSNTSVATVNSNGKVTAVGLGSATITATANDGSGVKGTCSVTVEATPVTQITLSQTTASLKVGETITLTATVSPSNATDKSVSWTSDNEEVALVSSSGKVIALGLGNATIYATANDGSGVYATCAIIVEPELVNLIELSETQIVLNVGDTFILTATVYPENALDKSISWSSENEDIAFVSNNGKVVAMGIGVTNVVASSNDGSGVTAVCRVQVDPIWVTEIILSEKSLTMKKGEVFTLNVTVLPEDATDKSIKWTSDNEDVALVNSNGKVVALSSGIALVTVSATDGSGVYDSTTIVVEEESAITEVQSDESDPIVYGLMGNRKTKMTEGINIIRTSKGSKLLLLK